MARKSSALTTAIASGDFIPAAKVNPAAAPALYLALDLLMKLVDKYGIGDVEAESEPVVTNARYALALARRTK